MASPPEVPPFPFPRAFNLEHVIVHSFSALLRCKSLKIPLASFDSLQYYLFQGPGSYVFEI